MGKSPRRVIDWGALKMEFLSCTMPLNHLRKAHKINKTWFFQKTKGWDDARVRIQERAVTIAEERLARTTASGYQKYIGNTRKLLEVLNAHIAAIHKRSLNKEGNEIIAPLKAGDITAIAVALNTALKTFRLLEGKSTEITDERHTREYWLALIDHVSGDLPDLSPEMRERLGMETAPES